MTNKVILISIDGMRPDGLLQCGNPYVRELEKMAAYTYSASSMIPSVTLPCHYSMAHSVTPQRHGIITNTYVPEVRPVKGLFERIKEAGGKSAMFYGWEPIRDIARPGSLMHSKFMNYRADESVDTLLTDECDKIISEYRPDFAFLYLVDTDDKGGHDVGWMSDEYLRRISIAIDNVKRIIENHGAEYHVIIMADHGGHDRTHGHNIPEDMTIPFFFIGESFTKGEIKKQLSLLDIAPTITAVMGISPDEDWEGKSII